MSNGLPVGVQVEGLGVKRSLYSIACFKTKSEICSMGNFSSYIALFPSSAVENIVVLSIGSLFRARASTEDNIQRGSRLHQHLDSL
jgi:hypothetical protein